MAARSRSSRRRGPGRQAPCSFHLPASNRWCHLPNRSAVLAFSAPSSAEVMRLRIAVVIMACALNAAPIESQISPLSRLEAVQTALDRGARLAVARADTALARAALITAEAIPNPNLTGSYSKSVPQYHLLFDVPVGFLSRRSLAEA